VLTTADRDVLSRSDRYLRDFVERLHLCPYAQRCRETGKLQRRVLWRREDAVAAIREIEALPEDAVEVALLIFPAEPATGDASARAFTAFCAELREQMSAAHGGQAPFYAVAFHPDLPRDLLDANRAVHFIRRSPDPTLQLVRASVLQAVRGRDDGGSRYLDPAGLSLEQAMALASPASLADRIARANFSTLQREGAEQVEALLESLRDRDHP